LHFSSARPPPNDRHPTSTTAAKEPPMTTTYGTIATGKGKGKEKGNCALRENELGIVQIFFRF